MSPVTKQLAPTSGSDFNEVLAIKRSPKPQKDKNVQAEPCPHDIENQGALRGPDPTTIPGRPDDVSYPPGGEDHLAHRHDHREGDSHTSLSGQLTAIFILRIRLVAICPALGFALSTPVGVAAGVGAKPANAATQKLVNGIFDSISAGILMYTGLVELLAHEFMFNPHMRRAPLKIQLFAFGCIAFGVTVMALLAKWA
ncbi:low-affinity Zn(2+) transporter zrt2 [Metarhizium acridum]|nr:low-affinity Zn(2+) transporter zrt2 [Metarhizium acridum]